MSALSAFFSARSIAVIGASPNPEKVGYQIFRNLVGPHFSLNKDKAGQQSFEQKLYPIHPTAKQVLGYKAYPRLTDVKDPVQLVVIATPLFTIGELVDEIIDRNHSLAAKEKVKAIVMITAGFAENGKKGEALQHAVATKLSLAGIRLLGPNTLGFLAARKEDNSAQLQKQGTEQPTQPLLNASFAQQKVPVGNLGVISQSGAMLTALFNALESRQAGISFAVSLGNKADISENECLEFALTDHQTAATILYLESFRHLPTFFELTSKLCAKKPVLVLKGGTSERGQTASSSHTAALATNQVLLESASQQMGFTLVKNMEELLNTAFFLAHHRQLPENVMVITNAGGPAVNTIDWIAQSKIPIAKWSTHSKQQLDDLLPNIPAHNPLDLLGDADEERFRRALRIAQRDPEIESIVLIVTPQAVTDVPAIVEMLIAEKGRKPLFVALMGGDHLEPLRQKLRAEQISCTAFPNDLVDMVRILYNVAEQKYRTQPFISSQPHTPTRKAGTTFGELNLKTPTPDINQAFQLLRKFEIPIPKYYLITDKTLSESASVSGLPFPLFAKTANLSLLHKKSIGAVFGPVKNAADVKNAYTQLEQFGNQVLLQEMVKMDTEVLLGVENDPQFGLYMTVGLGGSQTNLMADRAYIFLPATQAQLKAGWLRTKAAESLKNSPEISAVVVEQMIKLQKLIIQNNWIKSIEINPLGIDLENQKIWAADIKIQVR